MELGIRDGSLDLIGAGDTPLLQARLRSSTSNLGVSGSQVDDPFFNQHIDVQGRERGIHLDLGYDRIRTEQLRRFPNTAGAGLLFDDRTDPDDRFFRDRTGFAGELCVQPYMALDAQDAFAAWLRPQLSLRGGYESRGGTKQLLVHRDPSNEWLGLPRPGDRSVWHVGTGIGLSPLEGVTLSFDYDYERFRFDSSQLTEGDLGYPPPASDRSIGFVPSSERSTVRLRLQSRLASRAHLRAGFRYSTLEQIEGFAPTQQASGLEDNRVRSYAGHADLSVDLMPSLALRAAIHFNRRSNDIDRTTAAFGRFNGTQVDVFLWNFNRVVARLELDQRLNRLGQLTLGLRYEGIDRDLQHSEGAPPRILPENAWVKDETQLITVFARSSLRPLKRLRLFGELGYRTAPDTGYITELDNYVYGKLRASYVVPLRRPLVVTGYLRGHRGDNSNFSAVAGLGPSPAGAELTRSHEVNAVSGGLTLSHSPVEDVSLYLSFYGGRNEQENGLDTSNLQRYIQDSAAITFDKVGANRFHDRQLSLVAGFNWRIARRFDSAFSYSFTQAQGLYRGSPPSTELDLIEDSHRIDSDIHGIDLEFGTWLQKGLRVVAGYRLQYFTGDVERHESVASVVMQGNRNNYQHTFTLGMTMTSEFFER